MADENEACKFCVLHEYGVYVLNVTAFVVGALVITVYWRNIVGYCTGTSKPVTHTFTESPIPPEVTPSAPIAPVIYPQPFYMSPLSISQVPTMIAQAPPMSPPPPVILPPQPAAPQPTLSMQGVQTFQPPMKTDAFKLPTKHIKSQESTGSSYLKEMMRGKKAVKSISQYNLAKVHGAKKHKDDGKKRKKHHHNKGARQNEKQKFENEARILARGLP